MLAVASIGWCWCWLTKLYANTYIKRINIQIHYKKFKQIQKTKYKKKANINENIKRSQTSVCCALCCLNWMLLINKRVLQSWTCASTMSSSSSRSSSNRHHYFIISSSSKKKSPSLAAENKLFDTLIQSWILSLGIFHRWETTSWMAHPCVLITIYLFSALRQLHQKEDDRKFKVEKLENQLKPKIYETKSRF